VFHGTSVSRGNGNGTVNSEGQQVKGQGRTTKGGATVLKVGGGTILRAERAKKNFLDPPLFGQWGDKILL